MLHLVICQRISGKVIIDTVANERIVYAIAERFRESKNHRVSISYP